MRFLTIEPDKLHFGTRDFLEVAQKPNFDRVVMNPPFAKQADIAHVRHALGFVKPGGRLVSVMSAAVTWKTDRRTQSFHAMLESGFGFKGYHFEDVPEGAFKESGTAVRTVILVVDV